MEIPTEEKAIGIFVGRLSRAIADRNSNVKIDHRRGAGTDFRVEVTAGLRPPLAMWRFYDLGRSFMLRGCPMRHVSLLLSLLVLAVFTNACSSCQSAGILCRRQYGHRKS